jgi:DNA-binding CsgD family transcriptional regulator/sugar lactone lactonase YvrE
VPAGWPVDDLTVGLVRYAEQRAKDPSGTRLRYPFSEFNTGVQQMSTNPPDSNVRLSRREMEIARLVAEGLTNRDIAARLFISERTVDGHLEHVREKLGVNSRAQIATWVTRQGTSVALDVSVPTAAAPPLRRARISTGRLWLAVAVVVVVAVSGVLIWARQPAGPTITTLAGAPPDPRRFPQGSYVGEGISATAALLSLPSDVAVARDGAVYFADFGNYLIRRVDAAGTIVTVAGFMPINDAVPAPLVDKGYGPNADIGFASSITVDGAGNLFLLTIRDSTLEVWMVSPTHFMSLVTKVGPSDVAISDFWAEPVGGLAVANDGTLYIADRGGNRVWRYSRDHQLAVYAGTGVSGDSGDGAAAADAKLHSPIGLAVDDRRGYVYIADSANNRIRKVDRSGVISPVAGTGGFYGDAGDGGPALQAHLSFPFGVAIAHDGTLFISDTGNNRVREVTPSGQIQALAGTGQFGFTGDGGAASRAELSAPEGIAVDGAGNLFVADTINQRVRKLSGVAK